MKITILESKEHKFTRDEYKFLQLLKEDKTFEKLVYTARKILGIPQSGFDINKGHNLPENKRKEIKLIEMIALIRGIYNLPPDWFLILASIIYYSSAKAEGRERFPTFYFEQGEDSVVIRIKENMSIRDVKKLIDKKSKELKSMLQTLPGVPQIKIENILVKKRILELKNEKKKDSEIAKILEDEFGDTLSFSPDYFIISTQRNRFEKSLSKILEKDVNRAVNIYQKRFRKPNLKVSIAPKK